MSVITYLQTIFHAWFLGMLKIYPYTKFHTPSLNGPLVIAAKLKPKEIFRTGSMLLFYSVPKNFVTKIPCFSIIYYLTQFQENKF